MFAAVAATGGVAFTLEKMIGRKISAWVTDQCEPNYKSLIDIETASGVDLDEYLPEVKKGVALLRNAKEWAEAFNPTVLRQNADFIGDQRGRDVLKGTLREDTLKISTLIGVCQYHEMWEHGEIIIQPKEARKADYQPSPTTGRCFAEYIADVLETNKINAAQLAKTIGEKNIRGVYRWASGQVEPRLGAIRRIEKKYGMPIARYIPEVDRAVYLLQNWKTWESEFTKNKLDQNGIFFSTETFNAIRRGTLNEKCLSIQKCIRICNYYEERHGAIEDDEDLTTVHGAPIEKGEPGLMQATKAMRWAIGLFRASEFNLQHVKKNIWKFETRRFYVCEIDFEKNELRAYFKKTGELSFRKELWQGEES